MPIPNVYSKQKTILPTYSFTDIVQRNGILQLFGAKKDEGYFLTPYEINSQGAGTYDTLPSTPTTVFSGAFAITIQTPMIVDGLTTCQVPVSLKSRTNASTCTTNSNIWVTKDSGNISTTIINEAGTQLQNTSGSTTTWRDFINQIETDFPKTAFKIGDTLTLTVAITSSCGAGTGDHVVFHDPAGRATDDVVLEEANVAGGVNRTSADTTQMILNLPVIIDI